MQADAYAGFNHLYEIDRKLPPIIEAACWAHTRRNFFELASINKAPIAAEAVREINGLTTADRRSATVELVCRTPRRRLSHRPESIRGRPRPTPFSGK